MAHMHGVAFLVRANNLQIIQNDTSESNNKLLFYEKELKIKPNGKVLA
jgi:hypothetical protein